jgi:hypothetical protein
MAAGRNDKDCKAPPSPREARLAKALRDNLRRRKSPKPPGPPAGDKDARDSSS